MASNSCATASRASGKGPSARHNKARTSAQILAASTHAFSVAAATFRRTVRRIRTQTSSIVNIVPSTANLPAAPRRHSSHPSVTTCKH